VETAAQMHDAVQRAVAGSDIFISCAAVADFRPLQSEANKIKKTAGNGLELHLEPTVDIVSEVASGDNRPAFVVGFAAETQELTRYARDKLERTKLDMIAANQVGQGQGFAVDENALQVFWNSGEATLPLKHKVQLARDLMTLIIRQFDAKNTTENS
jgi:phosphopantothenoylcysteine decarboxylase/phosphopantothenate--cysteine ligase